jgi:hypothetical protein
MRRPTYMSGEAQTARAQHEGLELLRRRPQRQQVPKSRRGDGIFAPHARDNSLRPCTVLALVGAVFLGGIAVDPKAHD